TVNFCSGPKNKSRLRSTILTFQQRLRRENRDALQIGVAPRREKDNCRVKTQHADEFFHCGLPPERSAVFIVSATNPSARQSCRSRSETYRTMSLCIASTYL